MGKLNDIFRSIKWAYQRITRKWDDTAVWSVDWYLTEILPPMLKKLKDTKQGVPGNCYDLDPKSDSGIDESMAGDKTAIERWNFILDDIIYTFETARKIQELDWLYTPTEKFTYEKYNKDLLQAQSWLIKDPELYANYHVMSYDECKRYEKGWYNFQQYFFDLWD